MARRPAVRVIFFGPGADVAFAILRITALLGAIVVAVYFLVTGTGGIM